MHPPQTPIAVNILSRECLPNKKMALTADQNNKLVVEELVTDPVDTNQQWILVPNLTRIGYAGGYTLYNVGKELSVEIPQDKEQIGLSDDRTPYGSSNYAWWFADGGELNGEKLWRIQKTNQGGVMDLWGSVCKAGTPVKLYRWVVGDKTNQKWVINRVQIRPGPLNIKIENEKPSPNNIAAIVSRSGVGAPNHVTFEACDQDYTITLFAGFWLGYTEDQKVPLPEGDTSDPYELNPDAPVGLQEAYGIAGGIGPIEPPEMFIEP